MCADMNNKDESMKSELKEQNQAMKLTEAHSDLDSNPMTLVPAAMNAHSSLDLNPTVKPATVSESMVTSFAKKPEFAGVFSNPELWQKWKANKLLIVVSVFVFLQGLMLIQLQKPETYIFLGNFGLASIRDREANFHEALLLDPESSTAIGQLGQLAFLEGNFEKAIRYASQSLHLKPSAETYGVLALSYLAQNNLKEAEKTLEDSVKEFPVRAAIARAELGWVQKELGKTESSREQYRKALADKTFPQLALDFHHFGYNSRQGMYAFPKNAYLTLAFEDIAIDLHVENIDPLRLWYAHLNKASAYNELYQPEKSVAESRLVIARAEAKLNGWDENHYDLAEASFFAKDYKAAIKYANQGLSGGDDEEEEPWSLLFKNLSMAALHQKVDLSTSKKSFQKFLETEIAKLRKHDLNKRADDLQLLLNPLERTPSA
jgi:tetratricopeptide (TPR) repeat protein